MLMHSTSPWTKVGTPFPYSPYSLTLFPRDDGCDDGNKGRRLGNHNQHRFHALFQVRMFQDPPEQVIRDCDREVNEVLR